MRTIYAILITCLFSLFFVGTTQAQWVQTSLDSVVTTCFASDATSLFVGTLRQGVFHSTNNGIDWTSVNSGLPPNIGITAIVFSNENLIAGISDSGVFLSTDDGLSWTQTGLTNTNVRALAVSGTNMYAGYEGRFCGGGLDRSTDNGS